jgi:hypothetical protein
MAAPLQSVAPPPHGLGCSTSEFDHVLLSVDLRAAIRALRWKRSGRHLPLFPVNTRATEPMRRNAQDGAGNEIASDASPVRWSRQRRTSDADMARNSQEFGGYKLLTGRHMRQPFGQGWPPIAHARHGGRPQVHCMMASSTW